MADLPESMRDTMRRIFENTRLSGTCATCCWWHTRDGKAGLCRVNPPTPNQYGDGVWPLTGKDDWCGNHDDRDPADDDSDEADDA